MMLSRKLLLLVVLIIVSLALVCSQSVNDVKHENDYDQDEFEGFEVHKSVEKEQREESTEEMAPGEVKITEESKPAPPKTVHDFYMEIAFLSILVSYAINYFIGKNTNKNIVKMWGKKFQPLFDENFAKVGNRNNFTILKVNANTFSFVCTGRANCAGAQVTLDLKKRQDLISVFLDLVGYAEPDKMTIEVALNSMDPMAFALIRQKAMKKFKSDHTDIDLFCEKYTFSNLSANYAILADTEILPTMFLTPEVIELLNDSESLFESITFSDQSTIHPTKYPKALQGIFKFKINEMDKLHKLGALVIFLIDRISDAQLPKHYKSAAEKLRAQAKEKLLKQKHSERQEEAQKKRYEKLQKEKEAASKMTPEQQRRWDEKEHKKQLKKRNSKMVKVI